MEGKNMYKSKKKINSVKIEKQCRGKKNTLPYSQMVYLPTQKIPRYLQNKQTPFKTKKMSFASQQDIRST